MEPLSTELSRWKDNGQFLEIYGRKIFVVTAGNEKAPALLILHGFPTFSYDFAQTLSRLSQHYYVVLHDHPGFGLSDKPEHYSYSLIEQAETALGVWQALGIQTAHLLAHDYGTSVATEILARRQRGTLAVEFNSLTLCNGSVHIELAHLTLAQKLMRHRNLGPLFVRLANKRFFKQRFRDILGQSDAITENELDILWEGINYNDGRYRLPQISQYLHERVRFWHRWIESLQTCEFPTHVLWGREDPIAVEAIAQKLAEEIPHARLTWLAGLGHYPMLEDPVQWAEAVIQFLHAIETSISEDA